jgi:hypothetical protein
MTQQTSVAALAGNTLRTRLISNITFLLLVPCIRLIAAQPAYAQSDPVNLVLGMPGAAILNTTTISTGIPVINDGTGQATDVEVTTLTLMGSTLISPTLPFNLGTITAEGGMTPLFATFNNPNAFPGGEYTLTVGGTYKVGKTTFPFTLTGPLQLPAAAPGSSTSLAVSIAPNTFKGPFPAEPAVLTAEDADVPGWIAPIGPVVPATPSASTKAQNAVVGGVEQETQPSPNSSTVQFLLNQSISDIAGTGYPTEPSGATAVIAETGQTVVFITANSRAAYSINGGTTFTKLNPTTIFNNKVAGGFCCDQIVQYVPRFNLFVWLMQFRRATVNGVPGGNLQRLAVATPEDIVANVQTAWTSWDLTSADFGLGSEWMDYPDLSVGTNDLYISVDAFGAPKGGLMVVRVPFKELVARGTINFRYTTPLDSNSAWGSHLAQNPGNTIFWAGNEHTSGLRVFSWPESSNDYSWLVVPIHSWSNTNYSSTTPSPGKANWLQKLSGFPNSGVIGGTRSGNDLWLAWSAGTDSNFPMPHVEMVELDISSASTPTLKKQVQIWNSSYAFAYPALFTSNAGEIGLSLEYGGNGNFENHVVGFWGDYLVYITTDSSIGVNRFGDYVTIRRDSNPKYFDAFGYGMLDVKSSGQSDVHFIIFGRP